MLQSDNANQKGGATRLLVCAAQLMIGRLPHLPRWLSAELDQFGRAGRYTGERSQDTRTGRLAYVSNLPNTIQRWLEVYPLR